MKRIFVLGGTGRVGSAVARRLLAVDDGVEVLLAGRRTARGVELARALGPRAGFTRIDACDRPALVERLRGSDLLIHAAGPFQGAAPAVLEAAIEARVPYLDIADDIGFARAARALRERAVAAGVPAVTNGGLFPGLSNVMAGALVERGAAGQPDASGPPERIDFSYFVAGTGGAGPAVMASTFALAAQPATEYVAGARLERRSFTGRRRVEFLAPVGRRACYHLELPEVSSCFESYAARSLSARFGTAPGVWNAATRAMRFLLPRRLLANRRLNASFVALLLPLLRLVDRLVGAAAAMRIEVVGCDGVRRAMSYAHPDAVAAIAEAVAAQADELLAARVAPGVWWPEQAITDKPAHIRRAVAGARVVEEEQPP